MAKSSEEWEEIDSTCMQTCVQLLPRSVVIMSKFSSVYLVKEASMGELGDVYPGLNKTTRKRVELNSNSM